MTAPRTGRGDALDPARSELLRAARSDADALLAEARQEADRVLRDAQEEAAAICDRARSQGAADGAAFFAEQVRGARRAAARARLAGQGEIWAEVARQVTGRVGELCTADPSIADRLTARARALLGPEARTSRHPAGGVLGTAPGRAVDLGVPALAGRALETHGAEVEALWKS